MMTCKRSALSLVLLAILVASDVSGQSVSSNVLHWVHYREIGPTRPGGRVVAFAVSQQNPYVFYVGAGPGGLWNHPARVRPWSLDLPDHRETSPHQVCVAENQAVRETYSVSSRMCGPM